MAMGMGVAGSGHLQRLKRDIERVDDVARARLLEQLDDALEPRTLRRLHCVPTCLEARRSVACCAHKVVG